MLSSTSAWISTSSGRVPSHTTITTLPGEMSAPRERKIAEGLRTSRMPRSVIANTPSSFTAPKRFLPARSERKRLSPSSSSMIEQSMMCSSTLGPASVPSLVT